MKKTVAVAFAALMLSLGLLVFIPQPARAVLTWTTIDTLTTGATTATSGLALVHLDESQIIVAFSAASPAGDLISVKCTVGVSGCSVAKTIDSDPTGVGTDPKMHKEPGVDSTVFVCYSLLITATSYARFSRSTDGGISWSPPTVLTPSGGSNGDCGKLPNGDIIVIARNNVNDNKVYRSTDFGATFTAGATLGTADDVFGSLHVQDTLNWTALSTYQSTTLRRHKTVDGGATWTIAVQSGVSIGSIPINADAHSSLESNVAIGTSSSLFFLRSNNGGVTYSQVDTATSPTNINARDVSEYLPGTYSVSTAKSAASTTPCQYTQSTDNGLSWSGLEAPFTLGANTGDTTVDVEMDTGSTGVVVLACYYRPSAGNREVKILSAPLVAQAIDFESVTDSFGAETLAGFDVDDTGTILVARFNDGSGQKIRTWNAGPLGSPLSFFDEPNCNRVDGVMGQQGKVMFSDCEASGDVNNLRIRDYGDLATYTPDSGCDNCPSDIGKDSGDVGFPQFNSANTFGSAYEILQDIQQIGTYPIDGTNRGQFNIFTESGPSTPCSGDPTNCEVVRVAWSFTTNDGRMGVMALSANENHFDVRYVATTSFANQQPSDLCTWFRTADNHTYIGGVSQIAATKVMRVDFTETSDDPRGNSASGLQVSLAGPIWSQSSLGFADGIDCAGEHVIIKKGSDVWIVAASNGNPESHFDSGPTENRGVALSPGGAIFAYLSDSTHVKVGYTSNASVQCTINFSGTFRGMEIVGPGQNLWVATTASVGRAQIGGECGSIPIQSDVVNNPPVPTPSSIVGGLLGGGVRGVGDLFGTGETGSRAIYAVFLILIMGGLGWSMGGGGDHPKSKTAAVVGVAMAAAMFVIVSLPDVGLLPPWVPVATVLLAVIVMVVMRARRGGGD